MSNDYDIIMGLDETLELDLAIDKWNSPNNIINTTHSKDYSLTGIQTKTGIYDPKKSGTHNITINGQTLTVEVTEPTNIPSSVLSENLIA